MDFQYRYQPYMMMESQRDCVNEYEGDDIGNDPFYTELARQVLLLTAEDEDDDNDNIRNIRYRDAEIAKDRSINGSSAAVLPGNYFSWSEKDYENTSVPPWLLNLWKTNGTGTGVFIPHVVVKSKRKNKPKKNNHRGRKTSSSTTGEMQHGRNFNWQGQKHFRTQT